MMIEVELLNRYDIDASVVSSPISTENPSGEYLKYSEEYDKIMESLREDNPRLAQGIWEKPLKKADWNNTKLLSSTVLKDKSKDLQVASWLSLALVKLHGLPGLSLGLKIISELCTDYWDTIHPLPQDDDYDTRLAPFFWIDEKLFIQIKQIPISAKPINGRYYTYESWESDNIKLKHVKDAPNPVDKYLDFVETSYESFHTDLEKSINESIDTLEKLKEFLYSKNLGEYPHFVTLEKTLEDIKSLNQFALAEFEKGKKITEPEEELSDTDVESVDTEPKPSANSGRIFDEESAYQQLTKAAKYLIEKFPDHPSGHIALTAVEFRNKSLKQSIAFHIKDENILKKIFDLLSI